ncbi:MAG: 30S ribosomal protein S7 [Candidatus Pacebacteria bacterium]|nr:30S ribosomal protein S7 [Candidatus Paceibacterota bacterium]
MRRPVRNRNIVGKDRKYGSEKLSKFINHVMLHGKKDTAINVVYRALDKVAKDTKTEDPMEIFDLALSNAGPQMEVRSRRVGGANYQVPREVRPERRQFLAMTWIIDAAKSGKGRPMYVKLAEEIVLASKNEGEAVKKRENTHKMAEANKAFAHFAW